MVLGMTAVEMEKALQEEAIARERMQLERVAQEIERQEQEAQRREEAERMRLDEEQVWIHYTSLYSPAFCNRVDPFTFT